MLHSTAVCAVAPPVRPAKSGRASEQRGGEDGAQPADGGTRARGDAAVRGSGIEAIGSMGAGALSGGAGRLRR